jgi:hypothetical protein
MSPRWGSTSGLTDLLTVSRNVTLTLTLNSVQLSVGDSHGNFAVEEELEVDL